ncbi:MAG TPA: porin, partial [Casimicrobiaceae bacterium]|nr:porin [Casimicrobiaceae bacterium]
MSRSRRAISVLAALMTAAPAAAQTVTVYGRLFPEVVWVRMTGSTPPGTEVSTLAQPPTGETFDNNVQMDSSNSRLGFR